MVPGGLPKASAQRKHQWGSRDFNPGPTDYECDRIPHERFKIGRFVRGWLPLAEPGEQRFSRLCATNVPQDLGGSSVACWVRLSHPGSPRHRSKQEYFFPSDDSIGGHIWFSLLNLPDQVR